MKKDRIIELDIMRGIAVILMIFDHFMFDIWGLLPEIFIDFPSNGFSMKMYEFALNYWNMDLRIIIRYIILFVFLGITGICCSFSRNNFKRGLKLLIVSIALTAVTFIIGIFIGDIDLMISFGVLHCIAISLLIISVLEKYVVHDILFLIIGLFMISFGIIFEANVTIESYIGNNFFVLLFKQMIGLASAGGDCFPLLLFGGQVFVGVYLGRVIYKNKKSLFNKDYHNNPITFIGRNSLAVYFIHQIVIPLILGVILLICGFKLKI